MEHYQWWSKANCDVANQIIYNAEVLKSNLCDYNDAYILVRGNITIIGHAVTQATFKNCIYVNSNCIQTIAVPLKYLSNFWRWLEMPLISCKVELKLNVTKY